MKLIKNLKLTLLIFAAFEVAGCNNAGYSETNKAHKTPNSRGLQNGQTIYDSGLLGDTANVFSNTSKDNIPDFNASSCLNPNAFRYGVNDFTTVQQIKIKYADSSAFSSLLAGVSASGGYSIFRASAEASVEDTSSTDEKSLDITVSYQKQGYLTMDILSQYNNPSEIKNILLPQYRAMIDDDVEEFRDICNTGYVKRIGTGATFIGNLRLTFDDSRYLNKFKAAVSADVGSFASFSASLQSFAKETKSSFNLTIETTSKGAGANGIKNLGSCSQSNISHCIDLLNDAMNDFATSTESHIQGIQSRLQVTSSRDDALRELNSLSQNGDLQFATYPKLLFDTKTELDYDTPFKQEQRQEIIDIYASLGKLQLILDLLRSSNLQDKDGDAKKLRSLSDTFKSKLPILQHTCFGSDPQKCRSQKENELKIAIRDLKNLEKKYNEYLGKSYYTQDKDVYFMQHTDTDNTIHLYPFVLNNGYEQFDNMYIKMPMSYFSSLTWDGTLYLNPVYIAELIIKDGNLSVLQITGKTNTMSEALATCDVTESQIKCNQLSNPNNKLLLPPSIYKTLDVTTDDIDKARKKSFFESDLGYLSDSLEHNSGLNPTLSTTKPWCVDKTLPDDSPGCLQLAPKSLQFNGGGVRTPTEEGYTNDSITIKHLTQKDTGVTDIDADVFYLVQKNNSGELKLTSLATIFSPTGTNLYYRLDPNKPFNFIGYPERSLINIANQAKTEAQFADLLDQAKKDNQISFTRVDFAGNRIRMKGEAVFCHLKTSGVCYGEMESATLKSKATLYSTSAKRGTDSTTTTDHHIKFQIEDSAKGTFESSHDTMSLYEYKILKDTANFQFFDPLSVARSNPENKGFQSNNHHHVDGTRSFTEFRGVIKFKDTTTPNTLINCPVTLSVKHRYVNSFADDNKGEAIRYCDNPEWVVLPWGNGYYDYVAISKISEHPKYRSRKVADDVGVLSLDGVFLED